MEETSQVSINTEELILKPFLSSSHSNETNNQICIYRIHPQLRENNEGAYSPRVISIGPLHHSRNELKAMDEHKRRFLDHFLLKSGKGKSELLQFVMEREARLRNCYSEAICFNSQDFGIMILVDATFIIEFFCKMLFCEPQCEGDRLLSQPYLCNLLPFDLLLLENQIPFFILHELLDFSGIVTPSLRCVINYYEESPGEVHSLFHEGQKLSITKMMYMYFRSYRPLIRVPKFSPDELDSMISSSQHLLGFLRACLVSQTLPPRSMDTNEKYNHRSMLTATQLHQAGVWFQKSESDNYFDIQFDPKKGVLKIPFVSVAEPTEILFRNMVAFEQFPKHGKKLYFAGYNLILCLKRSTFRYDLIAFFDVLLLE